MDFVLDHDANLFVLPAEPIRWVNSKVQRWSIVQPRDSLRDRFWKARHHSSQTTSVQVLGLVGERGSGKSWLLRHLAEGDRQVSPHAVYVDLSERAFFPRPDDFVQDVERRIRERVGNERAVLLLDDVPPHMDAHLRALEDEVLRPCLMKRGCLVIMALVHPSRACWRAPILRGGDRYVLPPFNRSQTRDQLQRLRKRGITRNGVNLNAVHEASSGLPLLNYLLSTHDRTESFDLLLKYWLESVPVDQRRLVQNYLQAVCALDVLEQLPMQRLLDLYDLYRSNDIRQPPHAGAVRRTLHKYQLAQSMPSAPGQIALVGGVRSAAREVLRARDGELYDALKKTTQISGRRNGA